VLAARMKVVARTPAPRASWRGWQDAGKRSSL